MKKELLKILICPECHSELKLHRGRLICRNDNCRGKYSIINGIFVILPEDFKREEDYDFKKAQIKFFERWSSHSRNGENISRDDFDRFFFCQEQGAKINYSEQAMKKTISQLPSNSIVLELGCGAGEHTAFLAAVRDDIHLIAIDISPKSVYETRERIRKNKKIKCKVSYLVADAERLPFQDGSLNTIMAVMFYHHVASPLKSIQEIKRTLIPKGTALLVDMTSNNPFNVLPRLLFPLMPESLKSRLSNDYVLENGEIPKVSLHSIGEFQREIKKTGMKILNEKRFELFVLFIYYLALVFPFLKRFFSRHLLQMLYNVENRLIKKPFFRDFAGAVTLCFSR